MRSSVDNNKLKVLDLFSGIGGFSLGLERTGGFETVAFCEIEEFPQKVLAKHWPGVHIYPDITELRGKEIEQRHGSIDVICGGFPCQNISVAGSAWGVRTGITGERSGLWSEQCRLIEELGPERVVIENVSSLRSNGLAAVLQDLWQIGYDAEWHCIPASAFGSVQPRDRAWIIAYPRGQRVQGLLAPGSISKIRQGRACSKENLQQVYDNPFREARWPQPLVRGGRRRFPGWVDRIKGLGNSVDPAIPEFIGNAILADMKERAA